MPTSKWLLLDFETASATDLKKAGAWRYAECPTTEIICCGFSDGGGAPGLWTPDQGPTGPLFRAARDPEVTFIAFNAGFEKAIWRRIMVEQYGWPDVPNARWHDVMAVAAMRVIPLKMERAALVLRLPYQKDAEGSRITNSLSKPRKDGNYDRAPAVLHRVYEYCLQDIRTEVAMHERLGPLPPGERSVWLLDQRINERGVRLDLPFIRAARRVVDLASAPLAAEFSGITGGLKMTQRDKVLAWCLERGAAIPNFQKETLARLLGDTDEEDEGEATPTQELPPDVRRALAIRQLIGSASIKKLARMEACVGSDGRARGLTQYHGAGTGRWAGRLLQPQNFPRGTVKHSVDALVSAIMTEDPGYVEDVLGAPPVEVVISSLRHAIIADPGRALCVGDFSTIEARIVLALAGQHDKVDLIASGQDIYNDMASEIFGKPIDRKKPEFEKEGHIGKGAVLGLGFQMGPPKFQATVFKNTGIALELDFCKGVVDTYRKSWAPAVPEVWYGLERAAVRAVHDRILQEAFGVEYRLEEGWLTARLPSGRKLWYFNPQPTRRAMPWDDTDVRQSFTYQAVKMGQWRTIDAYGGMLTENVVQALARDLMVAAMFKAEKDGFPVILTVHDEIITEPETGDADAEALEQLMCDTPGWARELRVPVAAECWAGERYRK